MEITNAPEQSRTPLIDVSLAETLARVIRAAGGKLATDKAEKRWKFSNTRFLLYKKTIFRRRFHFARWPVSRTAEATIPNPLRFLEPTI